MGDHPEQSPRATAYLQRIEQGEETVYLTNTVIFEAVFTLERHYHRPRARIREALLPLIELPGIHLPGKRRYQKVFALYVDQQLPFADAYHAVLMEHLHLDTIVSFDRDFDRVPGIIRAEP